MRYLARTAMMATAIAVFSGAACAEQGLYVGGVLSQVEFRPNGGPTANPTAIAAVLGKEFSPNIAGEVRLGGGLGYDGNVEVAHYLGVYGKGILPLSNQVSLYGLLGVTSSKLNFRGDGSASDSGLSYGLGADFSLSRVTTIGVEWASLLRPSGYDLNALSVLAKFKF